VKYVVTADAKLIDGQVERIQNNLVLAIPQEVVVAGADLTGTFTNEEKGINNNNSLDIFKDKATADKFIGKKR
jgi:trigger factor